MLKQGKKLMQRGFTLIELIVVVAVLGVLIAIVAPNLVGSRDPASARLMAKTATDMARNWSLITQSAGVSTAITGSPLLGTGKTAMDLLCGGETTAAVPAGFQSAYRAARVMPLNEVCRLDGTNWVVDRYTVTLSGGGMTSGVPNPIQVAFANVPDEIVLLLAQQFNPSLTALAASDTTGAAVRYGTATNGLRTVTLLKNV